MLLFIAYMFTWSWQGKILTSIPYYYLLYAILLPCIFFLVPAHKKDLQRCPWYDVGIAVLVFGIFIYFYLNSWEIGHGDWVSKPSTLNFVLGNIIAVAALESARRITGYVFLLVVVLSGYGLSGPDKDRAAFDQSAFWARSGAMSVFGDRDDGPLISRGGYGDRTTALNLRRRDR